VLYRLQYWFELTHERPSAIGLRSVTSVRPSCERADALGPGRPQRYDKREDIHCPKK
jgi:hypothetical protein